MHQSISDDKYEISIRDDKLGLHILATSIENRKNHAVYRHYFKQNSNGKFKKVALNHSNIESVFKNVTQNGITSGFYIKTKGTNNVNLQINQGVDNPSSVRHSKTASERSFTSTGEKLPYHWPIFEKYKNTGYASIVRATMTLHQVCASRCSFCSTINRTRKDAISLEEAKAFVNDLHSSQAKFNRKNFAYYNAEYKKLTGTDIKLRGLILSGGGQPNLWPPFSDFISWLARKDIDLGLITNGFPKHVKDRVYDKFKWVRLSITPEDASPFYPEQRFDKQRIPQNLIENSNTTFGLSYVYGPWTTDDILKRLDAISYEWNVDYVRILTDCNLPRRLQLEAHKDLGDRLYNLNFTDSSGKPLKKIFHQLKYHASQKEINNLWKDNICGLQLYNTFWDTTGHELDQKSYCFPCDSVTVLESEDDKTQAERKFNGKKWGTVFNTEVAKLYKDKARSFFNPNEICKACLFVKNNKEVKMLSSLQTYDNIKLNSLTRPEHVNFP